MLEDQSKQALDVLSAPTKAEEIEWKFQAKDKDGKYATYVPYVDARALQRRLTDAFGLRWSKHTEHIGKNEHKGEIMFRTTTSVVFDNEMISRDGYASATDIEPTKGGESDSFKRAGVMFGFGMDLYNYPTVKVELKEGTSYPICYPNELKEAWKKIQQAVANETVTPDDTIKVGAKGKCTVNKFGKEEELTSGKSTVSGAGINKKTTTKVETPKKEEPKTTSMPTLDDVKRGLWGGSGVLTSVAFDKAVENWMSNGGILLYKNYIYTVKDGKFNYFMLDYQQVKKLNPKSTHG